MSSSWSNNLSKVTAAYNWCLKLEGVLVTSDIIYRHCSFQVICSFTKCWMRPLYNIWNALQKSKGICNNRVYLNFFTVFIYFCLTWLQSPELNSCSMDTRLERVKMAQQQREDELVLLWNVHPLELRQLNSKIERCTEDCRTEKGNSHSIFSLISHPLNIIYGRVKIW